MHPAVPRDVNHLYRAEIPQKLEPLAGGAFAELQALDHVIHREWPGGDKQQAVDFGERSRLAEHAGNLDEKVNDFGFERAERRRGRGCAALGLFFDS
jgi:hypothetical protein